MSQYLECLDPSSEYTDGLKDLDAFERQLYRHNLFVSPDRAKGIKSVPTKYFLVDEAHRVLFKEYLDRTAQITMFDDKTDIAKILASTRFINGESAYGVKLDMSEIEANPYFQIGKAAKIPVVGISWQDTEAHLAKKGVGIKWTYEFLRRANIDLIRIMLERIALADKKGTFNYAAGYLFGGASVTKTVTLDSTVTATKPISYLSWLKALSMAGVYTWDKCLATESAALKITTMDRPNIDPSQVMNLLASMKIDSTPFIGNEPNFMTSPEIMIVEDGTFGSGNDDKVLLFDSRFALERIVEQGSDIRESQKFIADQTELTVQTINEGFEGIFNDAKMVLHITES